MNPKLTVTGGSKAGPGSVTISATENATDDALGELQIYVPAGFTFTAPTASVGEGTVTAIWTDRDPTAPVFMQGGVAAVSTSDPRLAQASSACDTSGHLAAWIVSANGDGGDDTFTYPIFVDQTAGAETKFGAYKLVACFLTPFTGVPTREPAGNKFVSMAMSFSGFGVPAKAGAYLWRSLWTPFAPNTGTLNPTANVEAQSTESITTSTLTETGKVSSVKSSGKARATLSGTLLVNGKPGANVLVAIHHGVTKTKLVSLGTARTNSAGVWKKTVTLGSTSYFAAGATLPSQAGTCQPSFGVPCLSATGGSTTVSSSIIRLRP